MAADALNIEYDSDRDLLKIDGMIYAGTLFRALSLAEPGTWLRIVSRGNGVLTVRQVPEDVGRTFDAIVGESPMAYPSGRAR